jgi:hypothetical protein
MLDRLKEPSSWSGISIVLAIVFPFFGLSGGVAEAVATAGAAITAVVAILMKEKGAK